MMNHTDGWMGGEMWGWPVIGAMAVKARILIIIALGCLDRGHDT